MATPPPPTKTGIWPFRRYRECHCKAIRTLNPHPWVRAYCPPQPMPDQRAEPDRGVSVSGDQPTPEARVIHALERWEGYGHGYYNVHPDASLPCEVCALIADVRAALRAEVSS